MTRDEALALLMQMHDLALIKPFGAEEQNAVFQGIRLLGIELEASLCACRGREPIEVIGGQLIQWRQYEGRWEFALDMLWDADHFPGRTHIPVDIIILPADEVGEV